MLSIPLFAISDIPASRNPEWEFLAALSTAMVIISFLVPVLLTDKCPEDTDEWNDEAYFSVDDVHADIH